MALPKKKKFDFNINPPKIGSEYMKYGMDRIEELMLKSDEKTTYLPKTIKLEDIDWDTYQYFNENMVLVVEGKKIPVIYLNNERWADFSKTWKLMDEDKNVPTPFITMRRTEKKKGTRVGNKYRVAQNKAFTYVDVPILDEGEEIFLKFKIPEPTNIDVVYELRLFSKMREDINNYDETMFRNFASFQGYIFVKGNPMPLYLDRAEEANTLDNADGDRFYVSQYFILVKAFIQDEKEFEITKTSRKPVFSVDLTSNKKN